MSDIGSTRIHGVADLVFVLDVSPSMRPIREALARNIAEFVQLIASDPQSPVTDLRVALVIHGIGRKVKSFGFTQSIEQFRDLLQDVAGRGQEFGLPAIDLALDLQWREVCKRVIVFLSDEGVASDGEEGRFQSPRIHELGQKMARLHVKYFGFCTVDCPMYSHLGRVPGSAYTVQAKEELQGQGMEQALRTLGATISCRVWGGEKSAAVPNAIELSLGNIFELHEEQEGEDVIIRSRLP